MTANVAQQKHSTQKIYFNFYILYKLFIEEVLTKYLKIKMLLIIHKIM